MPAVHIRDIPEEVLETLKRRAQRQERSLQGELRHILTSVAKTEPTLKPLPPMKLKLSDATPQTSWSRREIYRDDGR